MGSMQNEGDEEKGSLRKHPFLLALRRPQRRRARRNGCFRRLRKRQKTLGNEAKIGNDVTRCWRLIQIKFCLRQEVFVTLANIF